MLLKLCALRQPDDIQDTGRVVWRITVSSSSPVLAPADCPTALLFANVLQHGVAPALIAHLVTAKSLQQCSSRTAAGPWCQCRSQQTTAFHCCQLGPVAGGRGRPPMLSGRAVAGAQPPPGRLSQTPAAQQNLSILARSSPRLQIPGSGQRSRHESRNGLLTVRADICGHMAAK